MSFFDDISRFAGSITGGAIGESDADRRKREAAEAAKRQQDMIAKQQADAASQKAAMDARNAQASAQAARPTGLNNAPTNLNNAPLGGINQNDWAKTMADKNDLPVGGISQDDWNKLAPDAKSRLRRTQENVNITKHKSDDVLGTIFGSAGDVIKNAVIGAPEALYNTLAMGGSGLAKLYGATSGDKNTEDAADKQLGEQWNKSIPGNVINSAAKYVAPLGASIAYNEQADKINKDPQTSPEMKQWLLLNLGNSVDEQLAPTGVNTNNSELQNALIISGGAADTAMNIAQAGTLTAGSLADDVGAQSFKLLSGNAIKDQIAKNAAKNVGSSLFKEATKVAVPNAIQGAVGGVTSVLGQPNATPADYANAFLTGTLGGAVMGFANPYINAAISKIGSKGASKVGLDDNAKDAIVEKVLTEHPELDELKIREGLDQAVELKKASSNDLASADPLATNKVAPDATLKPIDQDTMTPITDLAAAPSAVTDAQGNRVNTTTGEIIDTTTGENTSSIKNRNNIDAEAQLAEIQNRRNNPGTTVNEDVSPEGKTILAKQLQDKRIAVMNDDDYVKQVAARFSMDPTTVQRLLSKTDKVSLFNRLNAAGEYVKGANSPDAAATAIVNKASDAGKAAARQAGIELNPDGTIKRDNPVSDNVVPDNLTPEANKSVAPVETQQTIDNGTVSNAETNDGSVIHNTLEPTEVKPSRLGNMVDDFYQSRKGNIKTAFKDVVQLGKDVAQQIDDDFRAIGSNTEDVFAKVQDIAKRQVGGEKVTLADANLRPDEIAILQKLQYEMDYSRRRAATKGKRKIAGNDLGETYLPQTKIGSRNDASSLLSGFKQETPGNELKRNNKIALDEMDFSSNTIGSYITRYADTKASNIDRIFKSLQHDHPDVSEDMLSEQAAKIDNMQSRVNEIERHAFGSAEKGVDTAKEMSDSGKALGTPQTVVADSEKWHIEIGKRIDSVSVDGKPLGDYLGQNQYRDAPTYAAQHVANAKGDRAVLVNSVKEHLTNFYDLPQDRIDVYTKQVENIASSGVPDEVMNGKLQQLYKQAGNEQFMSNSQKIDIKNNKLRSEVDAIANQHLRGGSIKSTTGRKIVSLSLKTSNGAKRGFGVSTAINEYSDLTSISSRYGLTNMEWMPERGILEKWGVGEADPALESFIRGVGEANGDKSKIKKVFEKIGKGANLFHLVEEHKSAVFLQTAEKFYSSPKGGSLTGDALTAKVLADYREMILPVDEFTKTFLDSAPLFTQYQSWGLRNMAKETKLATGHMGGGILENKTMAQRIARNAYANIPAKSLFWLASNGLKGTAILTAFGLNDYTGMSSGDYSGINEDDKNDLDRFVNWVGGFSPAAQTIADYYDAWRKDQLKTQYADKDYNPYKDANLTDVITKTLLGHVYGSTQIQKTLKAYQEQQQGYVATNDGRVKYQTPNDLAEKIQGLVFGNSSTAPGREYAGNPTAIQQIANGENPLTAAANQVATDSSISNTAEGLTGVGTRDYQKPLTFSAVDGGYSKAATDAYTAAETQYGKGSDQAHKVMDDWIKLGRTYNNSLETFKKTNPTGYANWQKTFDDNIISPEKWSVYASNPDVFKFTKERKLMENKDLGRPLDPIYKISDTGLLKDVLAIRSANTGDMTEREEILKATSPKYNQYLKDASTYYDTNTKFYGNADSNSDSTTKMSDRQKAYLAASVPVDQPALVKQYFTIVNDSGKDAAKTWAAAQGDKLSTEFTNYSTERLKRINAMRAIEGVDPISEDVFNNSTYGFSTSGSNSGYSSKDYGTYTGGADSLTNLGSGASGNKQIKTAGAKLVNLKTVVKHKPASSQSKIRITI